MIVAGFQMRSPSASVSDTTYFSARLIQSVNGSPLRFGQAAARHLVGAASLEQDFVSLGELVDDRAHHLRIEELHRPATVPKPPAGVFRRTTGSLHHAVETHELAYDHSHLASPCQIEGTTVRCVDVLPQRNSSHTVMSPGTVPTALALTRTYRRTRAGAMPPSAHLFGVRACFESA
jgi:hypothetical protein